MPRKNRTGRRAPPPKPQLLQPQPADDEIFGYTPSAANLPPPPPEPVRGGVEPAAPPPESLVALGPPPESDREAQRWGYRALMLQVHDAMIDKTISATARRKEVRTILTAAARLYPDAARAEVADTIDKDRRQLEARQRAKAHAQPEARPPAGEANVIQFRRDA